MTGGEITIKKSMIQYKHQNNIYTRKKIIYICTIEMAGDMKKLGTPANVRGSTITE